MGQSSEKSVDPNVKKKLPTPTDDELRDRWLNKVGTNVVFTRESFHRYAKGVWIPTERMLVQQGIQRTIEAAKTEGIRPTKALLTSVTGLAETECARDSALFDSNHDLLCCRNGTLEISTRTLRKHQRQDWLTTQVPYDFDPNASNPAWAAFLVDLAVRVCAHYDRNDAGQRLVEFLQEFVGYCVTTDCRHEIAVWLHSPPGWGKSTFIEGVQAALADRCISLGLGEIERSRFGLADLPGKTLAIATEQPSNYVNSSDLLNRIISGETIRIEKKYRDAYDMRPTVKLLWAMNDLPRVTNPNSGIFRRVKVVSWPRLDPANKNPDVKEQIKLEGPGILNWALDGLDRLRQRGRFTVPVEVNEATKDFQEHNDVPALFLAECADLDISGACGWQEPSSDLYFAYRNWCVEHGHKPKSSTAIAEDWRRLSLDKKRVSGGALWSGLRLNGNANTNPPKLP